MKKKKISPNFPVRRLETYDEMYIDSKHLRSFNYSWEFYKALNNYQNCVHKNV